jgi:hypothetical protein
MKRTRPTKPFYRPDEAIRKQTSALIPQDQKWDAIMLPLILNAIYRHFLQAALSGIASQGARP